MPDAASGTRWPAWALLLVTVATLALALRLPGLDRRPMHNDEAVNAIVLQRLWERGEYRYDPHEFHGPTLHYASLPFLWLSSAPDFDHLREGTLRLVAVAAGVALILLVGLLRDALGPPAALLAAGFGAVSPAMVFYSRYFIHEMLLAVFTLVLLAGAWRYHRTRKPSWAVLAGAGLGLMAATKETFVLTLAALAVAGLGTLAAKRNQSGVPGNLRALAEPRHLLLAGVTAVAVAVLFFTSFFTHARGPLDAVLTYAPWLRRAGGASPHLNPWWYYFERLFGYRTPRGPFWSEAGLGLLAILGGAAAWTGRLPSGASAAFGRFLTLHAICLAAFYCAIPYKTPWCLLEFLLPMILLAGLGAAALLAWARRHAASARVAAGLALVGIFVHLGVQGWRAGHTYESVRGHPYAHSPTVPGAIELADRVKAIAAVSADGVRTPVKVIAPESDYWPLPWYLRQLRAVWWLDAIPADPYAPIIVVAARLQAGLDDRSTKRYLSVGFYELRPREFFELYVEFELWKRFVATLPRPKDDE